MSVSNIEGSGGAIEYACAQVKVAPSLIIPLSENGTDKGQRIKELEDALTFTVNVLTSLFSFCGKDISKLPTNLDATQYQTCSYEVDKALLEKLIKCRKLIKREVG